MPTLKNQLLFESFYYILRKINSFLIEKKLIFKKYILGMASATFKKSITPSNSLFESFYYILRKN